MVSCQGEIEPEMSPPLGEAGKKLTDGFLRLMMIVD